MRKLMRKAALLAVGVTVIILVVRMTMKDNGTQSEFDLSLLDPWPRLESGQKLVIFDAVDHTESLGFLDHSPPGWAVLVTNVQTPGQKASCSRCLFASSSWAESYLSRGDTKGLSTPVKIKMATYLSLMLVEPEWIYVTSKAEVIPYKALSRVVDNELSTGPVYSGTSRLFEPCHHFVDPVTWRQPGHPIGSPTPFSLKNVSSPAIYSVVDECIREDVSDHRWKTTLDLRAPMPYVMPGTFAVLDFRNVLLPRGTTWTLIAAIQQTLSTQNPTALDAEALKLNAVVQRVLWETQHLIGFVPSEPRHKRCSVCPLTSSMESLGLEFFNSVTNQKCEEFESITSCLEKMVSKIIVDKNVASLVKTWLQFLRKSPSSLSLWQPLTEKKLRDRFSGQPILFTPAKLLRNKEGDSYLRNPFGEMCTKNGQTYKPVIPEARPTNDIVTVIVINDVKYVSNIPLLEYLYARYFSQIMYCSTNFDVFQNVYQKRNPHNPVSLIYMPHFNNTQICTTGVIKMNYDVIGYLQYSDDVLINLWNYHNVPMDQAWFQHFIGVGQVTAEHLSPGKADAKYFDTYELFKQEMQTAWRDLQSLRDDPVHHTRVSKFLEHLAKYTTCSTCIFFGNADIYYVPRRIEKEFAFFADFIDQYTVHFELVIINVFGGLVAKQDIYRLSGFYAWGDDRNRYEELFNEEEMFYHPWKFSYLDKVGGGQFFCERYLRYLDEDLNRRSLGP